MVTIHIGLGSNIEPETHLPAATRLLAARLGVRAFSPVYRTPPWGLTGQAPFLNAAAAGATALPPLAVLDILQAIENELGRERGERWGPRTMDLDLLLHGGTVLNSERLTLPHPLLAERAFVLTPLADLCPELIPPGQSKTVAELLAASDREGIERVELTLEGGVELGK